MNLLTARRISQVFFLLLFIWLCMVLQEGQEWWQLSGWPVNLFLELDPLAMLGVLASSGVIHGGMLLALLTLLATMLWGRIFCGFVCPLGTLNHFISWLRMRNLNRVARSKLNQYHPAQRIKYYLLALFVAAALAGQYLIFIDPIPLLQRTVTLVIVPWWQEARQYQQAAPMALLLMTLLLSNLWRPRFFCRYLCPLGALLGLVSRLAWWRPRLSAKACINCGRCSANCQAAAEPQVNPMVHECVQCLNCLELCPTSAISFNGKSVEPNPPVNVSRRLVVSALALGALGVACSRVEPAPRLRPPGALPEAKFLARCLRCGQCIAVCPGNVLQPLSIVHGVENYLTPILNYNLGSCRLNCNACAQVCPSSAIAPFNQAMRQGLDGHEPIRLGLASINRNLCLPWAYNKPCLVCEENCPTSPKAINTRMVTHPLTGWLTIERYSIDGTIEVAEKIAVPSGVDLLARVYSQHEGLAVEAVFDNRIKLSHPTTMVGTGMSLQLCTKLAQPYVNPHLCVGCGVCQHVCPLEKAKGVVVYPENKNNSTLFI